MKIYILSLLIVIFTVSSYSQTTPCTAVAATTSSTECSMTTLTGPATNTVWSNNGAGGVTSGLVTTCESQATAGAGNYWLTFTAPAGTISGFIDLDVSGGGGTPVATPEFQVYAQTGGSCASSNMTLSYVGCGGTSGSNLTMVAGTTYYIRIFDDNADKDMNGEKFDYCIRTCTSNNDVCQCATRITPGTAVVGSNSGSTLTGDPFSGGGWCPDGNVWYQFTTPAAPGCYSFFSQYQNAGCNYVTVYAGACGEQGGVLENNNVSTNTFNDQGSSEFGGMLANTTYYVSVANTVAGGTFTLNVRPDTPAAANDLCSSPISIGTTSVLTDNAVAGCEYSYVLAQDQPVTTASLVCASSLENVSWFTFTAQNTGTVTISFSNIQCNNGGGGFQTGLFTGSCTTYTVGTSGTRICASGSSGTVTYSVTNAVAGQTYLIAMDGNAGSNCHFYVSGTNIVPLPIELVQFNAVLLNKGVDLTWTTASEKNNNYFTVERSADGVNFGAIGTVKGAGNSQNELNYYLKDNSPLDGISYYRLKQTDFDGKETYSLIKSISLSLINKFDFNIYPNPIEKSSIVTLNFTGKENDKVQVVITDISGKIVSEKELKLVDGATMVELKHDFEPGIYFIKAIHDQSGAINRKLIVE